MMISQWLVCQVTLILVLKLLYDSATSRLEQASIKRTSGKF